MSSITLSSDENNDMFMVHQNEQNSMLEKYVAQQHNQNSDIMVDIGKEKVCHEHKEPPIIKN